MLPVVVRVISVATIVGSLPSPQLTSRMWSPTVGVHSGGVIRENGMEWPTGTDTNATSRPKWTSTTVPTALRVGDT